MNIKMEERKGALKTATKYTERRDKIHQPLMFERKETKMSPFRFSELI